jgi:outer membrane protein
MAYAKLILSPGIATKIFSLFVLLVLASASTLVHAEQINTGEQKEVYAPSEYSLMQLFMIALERAEKIMISEENIFIAERQKDKALSSFLPSLSAFGDYTRYSEEKKASTSFGSFSIQPEDSSIWGFRLDQSISLGGREIFSYRISKQDIDRSIYDDYSLKADYLLEVSARYFDVLKAQKAVDIARANVERLTKYRDEAEIKLRVGEVTKTVLLRAAAELSGASSDLVKAKNLLTFTRSVLARFVGISDDFILNEKDNFMVESLENESIDMLKETALSERSEIQSYQLQRKIAEDQVKLARGSYWPTLSVEGIYSRLEEDPSSPFFNDESIYGVLSLNFPLFEGGLRRAEVREAEAEKRQVELQYKDLEKTIGVEVEEAYLNLQTQSGILQSLQDQFDFAKENFYMISKQFEFGLADSLDVMDANNLLVTSERDLARAQYNYDFAVLQLQHSTGKLLETVIGEEKKTTGE